MANEIDSFYLNAAESIILTSKNHSPLVFRRACIDFIASVAALSTPSQDISQLMDELYESYLYFAKSVSTRPPLPEDPPSPTPDP